MINSTTGYVCKKDYITGCDPYASNNAIYNLYKKWEQERKEKERRIKMKGDPNELRKKANNKSTRPKWLRSKP